MKISTVTSNQDKLYNADEIVGGVVTGATVAKLIEIVPRKKIVPKIVGKMKKLNKSLSADEFAMVEKAVANTIKNSGLEAKGVSIIKAAQHNADEISQIISKGYEKGIFKYLPKQIKERSARTLTKDIISGNNACFNVVSNKIVIPEKELVLAIFHEAGHAANANLSRFGRILRKCRDVQLLALPIALIALIKNKKAQGEEPKNNLDKVTTFVKNNAGKLTFAVWIPVLIEEGLATLKGNNFAKKLLSPDLSKKVIKNNALGFSTYLLGATASALGIYIGTKVKDLITDKKVATDLINQSYRY